MKILKIYVLMFLFFALTPFFLLAQERPILDWNFFKNDKPANAEHQAFTWSNISYQFKSAKPNGENIDFVFNVTLKADTAKSYFQKSKRLANDTALLKHEQGHVDISFIYTIKLKEIFTKSTFSIKNYKTEIKNIFDRVLEEMRAEQIKYDAETNHSKNLQQQKKWDLFLEKAVLIN